MPPLPHLSLWRDAYLSTGTSLPFTFASTVRTKYEETSQRRRPNIKYSALSLVAPASCSQSVTVEIEVHVGVTFLRAQFNSLSFSL
jgi:hypothetical protein